MGVDPVDQRSGSWVGRHLASAGLPDAVPQVQLAVFDGLISAGG